MLLYAFDDNGFYVEGVNPPPIPSPNGKGKYLIPFGATPNKPKIEEGYWPKIKTDGTWEQFKLPTKEEIDAYNAELEQEAKEAANKARIEKIPDEIQGILMSTDSIVTKYRDQLELKIETTLSTEQYRELLLYRQALRDLSHDEKWPDVVIRLLS